MQDKFRISARASAAAVGLAGGLMMLASTQPQAFASSDFDLAALFVHSSASNPSGDAFLDIFDGELRRDPSGGIVYANKLGGPMGVYGSFLTKDEPDITSVGGPEAAEGPEGAAQLTSLLNSTNEQPKGDTAPLTPSTVASESYSTANSHVLNVFADPAAMNDHLYQQNSQSESRPTIDDRGEVDCAGALTCRTDPSTQATTVTYPDGVVAVVQKVNNLTVVAYNAIRDTALGALERLRPPTDVEASAPIGPAPTGVGASPAPQDRPDAATDLALTPPTPTGPDVTGPDVTGPDTTASVDSAEPGDNNPRPVVALAAPNPEPLAKRGPLINVLRPARDFTPWRVTRPTAEVHGTPDLPSAVKSALSDLTDAVQGAFNRTSAGGPAGTEAKTSPETASIEKAGGHPASTSGVSNPPSSPAERSGLRSAGESRTASPSARRNGTGSQSSNAPGRRAADSGVAGPARRHR